MVRLLKEAYGIPGSFCVALEVWSASFFGFWDGKKMELRK
jgi:hypothetical protein